MEDSLKRTENENNIVAKGKKKQKRVFGEKQIIGIVGGVLFLYAIFRNPFLALIGGVIGLVISYVV